MLILIDRDELRMVAAAPNRKWMNLIGYVDFPGKRLHIVDSLLGEAWTEMDRDEVATLFKNMSGQEAPEYSEAIVQLRNYANTWPNYPKPESQLEAEAEQIFQEEQAEKAEEPDAAEVAEQRSEHIMRGAHQATIALAAESAANIPAEQRAAAAQASPKASAKPSSGEPAERPRQGITKRIWEIADELLAVTGTVGNLKQFRAQVIERAAAEGANSGTAATQFGKWKASKGL